MARQLAAADVRRLLDNGSVTDCAQALLSVVGDEDRRLACNALAPYADILPPLLADTPPAHVGRLLSELTGGQARRVLFGNFRQLPGPWLHRLALAMPDEVMQGLLTAMADGVDAPRQAARLLAARAARPAGLIGPLSLMEPCSAARLLGLVPMSVPVDLLPYWRATSAASLQVVEGAALPPETLRLRSAFDPRDRSDVEPAPLAIPGHALRLGQQPRGQTLRELDSHSLAWQRAVLEALPAPYTAELLGELASREPERAGLLLGGLSEWPLVAGPRGLARTLFRARAAAVLRASDEGTESVLVGLLDKRVRAGIVGRVRRRAPVAYPRVQLQQGSRRSRQLADGMRLVRLREQVQTSNGLLPLRVDLLELDPAHVDLQVRRSGAPLSFARLVDEVSATGRGGSRPDERVFRRLGLVRLAEVVDAERARAAVNGNFYIDYGHYLDALDLGIDLAGEPHVLLGDTIGWLVSQRRQLAAPLVHRGTILVAEDGTVSIRRIFVRAAVVRGHEQGWDQVDVPGPGRVLYTRLYGEWTPTVPDVVELSVSGGVVVAVRRGGGSRIPLLGFVLAVPPQQAGNLLDLRPGEPVGLPAGLPREAAPVREAMSCGPLLVRDGEVDLDLQLEGFGDKDTGVLPLSLTRAVDSFTTARSFVMTRGGTVVLGTVSGTQVGIGPVEVSVGMTFGELAALCVDLGADDAMGLDGGGSSALVAAGMEGSGAPALMNVPTGGSDVPPGAERFLSTYLLALPRTAG